LLVQICFDVISICIIVGLLAGIINQGNTILKNRETTKKVDLNITVKPVLTSNSEQRPLASVSKGQSEIKTVMVRIGKNES
jgi:hypothetical protein